MGALKRDIAADAVHLCLDMQGLFGPAGPWNTPWMPRVLPQISRLCEAAPHKIIFTRFLTPASAEDAGGMWRSYYEKWEIVTREKVDAELLELMPELRRFAPPAAVFDKSAYSAFSDGRLHMMLRARKTDTLILTGAETDVCVLSTALAAVDHGYRVIICNDAVCSSSDTSHDALIDLYNRRFDLQIELSDVFEVLNSWRM